MTELYHDTARNMLVYRTSNARHILQHIPDARPVNGSFVCVPNNLGNLQILRLLNLPIVAPMRDYDWPIVLGRQPCAHQKLMANFMVAHPKSFNLSDPGTMKTLSTLWACDYIMRQYEARREECRALIVSPLSVMEDAWGSEIQRNFIGRRTHRIVYGSADKRLDALRSRADFYLINYDGIGIGADSRSRPIKLGGLSEQLQIRDDIKIIAVDEARNYHDSTTRRHRVARLVFAGKPYLWLLTGTPTPNGPLDAYGQAKLVNGAKGKSMTGWKLETMTQLSQFKWAPKRGANDKVRELLSPAIRIGIEDVWDGPDMVTETRAVALTDAQQKAMTQLKRDFVVQLGNGNSVSAINEAAVRTKFLQISMGAIYDQEHKWHPIDAAPRKNELLSIVTDAPGKLIVFIPLTSVIRLVYGWLHGCKREVINGDVDQRERTRIFRAFQEEPAGVRILLCDPQSVAHGVNLFAARGVVWYGPTDKTELYLQGNKRAHRPGQKFPVTVTRLVSNPLEREIFRRLELNESPPRLTFDDDQGGKAVTDIITAEDKLRCVERELRMRKNVYPRWIAKGNMSEGKSAHEIACMEAIVKDYRKLAEGKTNMTAWTDEKIIESYLKAASFVAGEERKLDEALAKHKSFMESAKAELTKRLIERKAGNTSTDAGTAYLSDHLNVKVTDRDALLDWCKEHWDNGGGALIVIKPPVDAVRDYQAMHDGKNPPGTETSTHTRCNIRSK